MKFDFDEKRTWFMVTVPVHEWFLEGNDTVNDIVNDTVKLAAEVAGFLIGHAVTDELENHFLAK